MLPREDPLARRALTDEAFRQELDLRLSNCGLELLDNPYASHVAAGIKRELEEAVFGAEEQWLNDNMGLQKDGVALLIILWALMILPKRERQIARRLRRAFPEQPSKLDALPADWRGVLLLWAKQEGERVKWDTLLKLAGHANYQQAHELLESLLRGGWLEAEESREQGRWQPFWINFLDLGRMQAALGLPRRDDLARRFEEESARSFHDPRLTAIAAPLASQPPQRALDRLALLRALDGWIDEQRFGTRRDFALYARGGTKSLSEAQWDWIDAQLDLAGLGIQRHTPALWLRAPFTLCRGEQWLDLRVVPDCIALTPATIERCIAIEGAIRHWRVVENRTSFERVAREYGVEDAVLWVPGFAPSWWLGSVEHLITLLPAAARIACDPDPAGIEIALQAGRLWEEARLAWEPWCMDVRTLAALPSTRPLESSDRERLQRLRQRPLPADLGELAEWMLAHDRKGEQEGVL